MPTADEGKAFGLDRVYDNDSENKFQNVNPQTSSNSNASASGGTSRGAYRSPFASIDDEERSVTSITHTNTHQNARSVAASEINSETSESLVSFLKGSIRTKFESIIQFTDPEIKKLLSLGSATTKFGLGNSNEVNQTLKTNIKTLWEQLNEFLRFCIEIEEEYKDTTQKAAEELRKSMNILFQLQQMKVELELKDKDIKKLRRDVMLCRDKKADAEKAQNVLISDLAEKQKKILRMEEELAGLRERAGGNLAQLKCRETSEEITINQLKAELTKKVDQVIDLESKLSKKKEESMRLQTELSKLNREDAEAVEQRMEKIDKLRRDLNACQDSNRALEDENFELRQERNILLSEKDDLNQMISDLEDRLKEYQTNSALLKGELGAGGSGVDSLVHMQQQERIRELTERLQEFETRSSKQLDLSTSNMEENSSEFSGQNELLQLQEENRKLKSKCQEWQEIMLAATADIEKYEQKNVSLERELEKGQNMRNELKRLETQLKDALNESRKLRDEIHNMKGNIRVFARVRRDDSCGPENTCVVPAKDDPKKKITIFKRSETGDLESSQDFAFDSGRVFGPDASQETVFEEVAEFVQSALDGKCVCLLSYGQTGSGKTHTMQGSGSGEERGIIPRAMEQVGRYMEKMSEMGWEYSMEVSFVEIYNETLKDLLREGNAGNGESKRGSISPREGMDDEVKLKIKEIEKNGFMVVDKATRIPVDPRNDPSQIGVIMRKAGEKRNVGATAMNAQSSRSHAIFCLHLHGKNERFRQEVDGMLSLVDLAGSESVEDSQVTGAQLKETIAINSSLTHLRSVFTEIAKKEKDSFINYRNSQLTQLLKSSLQPGGKTLMMVNLSPVDTSYGHSLRTLQLSETVSKCTLIAASSKKKKTKDGNSPVPGQPKVMRTNSTYSMTSAMTQSSHGSNK